MWVAANDKMIDGSHLSRLVVSEDRNIRLYHNGVLTAHLSVGNRNRAQTRFHEALPQQGRVIVITGRVCQVKFQRGTSRPSRMLSITRSALVPSISASGRSSRR